MANLAYWDDPDGPWDRLTLDGKPMPGAWSVGAECARELDSKKSKGKDGARVKDLGYKPATIHLKGTIWNREQWAELQERLPALHPRKKGADRHPIKVDHPALAVMGVSKVYVQKIAAPSIGDRGLELDIECLEWTPPVEVKKKQPPPSNKSQAQLQAEANANAGHFAPLATGLDTGSGVDRREDVGRIDGVLSVVYKYSPAEIAAQNRKEIEDKNKAMLASLTPKREPTWYQSIFDPGHGSNRVRR